MSRFDRCTCAIALGAVALCGGSAAGQTGQLDQSSPWELSNPASWIAGFNLHDPSLTWQQQIRAGIEGRLEGVELRIDGAAGSEFTVRIRAGYAWATGPALFEGVAVKQTSMPETIFVDMTHARIDLDAGEVFVLEAHGDTNGVTLRGTLGPPAHYPEPLLVNTELMGDMRFGFNTYMLESTCYADCDGSTSLDVFDFLCFQDAFAMGDPYADCDGNQTHDIFDFLCFQDEFATGCP